VDLCKRFGGHDSTRISGYGVMGKVLERLEGDGPDGF
jgi:hypothetical protein